MRLRYAYFVTCQSVVKDPQTGEVTEVHCTYDPATRGGDAPDGRKVKSTLHWVSAQHAVAAEVRLYDRLFAAEFPDREENFLNALNASSLEVLQGCQIEPVARDCAAGRPGAVRAPGLLLRRFEALEARRARLQPHRRAEGHLG